MAAVTLALLALVLATTALYAFVGRLLLRRELEGDALLASRLFGVFWIALALATLLGLLPVVGGELRLDDLPLYVANTHIELLVVLVAVWALMYYFAFLLTGTRRLFLPITVFYAGLYAWVEYLLATAGYDRVDFTALGATLHAATPPSAQVGLAFVVLLVVPPVLGAIGYFRLLFRVEAPTQRYRIGLVSATMVLWFASSLAGQALPADTRTGPAWRIFTSLLGLAAAGLVLAAYRPPRWVQKRWGIESVA